MRHSHAVVAEISTQNPNVFYEFGYAHALRKPASSPWSAVRRGRRCPSMLVDTGPFFMMIASVAKKAVERTLEQYLKAVLGAA